MNRLPSPDELFERLRLAGVDWADKEAAASLLEETKKTLLASIMRDSLSEGVGKAETIALSSSKYQEHLVLMVEARREATKARVIYDSGRVFADQCRTWAATERAEMGIR